VGQPEASGGSAEERPGSGTSNRAFTATYGENEVPSGAGVDTSELLDNARADIRSGAVDPYSVLSKTTADGMGGPKEYAALAEHERRANEAVAKQKSCIHGESTYCNRSPLRKCSHESLPFV
jgi:hypothetical protein